MYRSCKKGAFSGYRIVTYDTSKLLGKQDKAMEILDTVKQDTGEMTDTLAFLKAVYRETLELKQKVLSRDVAEIKVKLKAG